MLGQSLREIDTRIGLMAKVIYWEKWQWRIEGEEQKRWGEPSDHDGGWILWEEDEKWKGWLGRVSSACSTVVRKTGPGQRRVCLSPSCSSQDFCISQEGAYVKPTLCPGTGTDPQEAWLSPGRGSREAGALVNCSLHGVTSEWPILMTTPPLDHCVAN